MASKTNAWVIEERPADSHSGQTKAMSSPKPRWSLLYTMIPLALLLLLGARAGVPSAGWREVADCVVSLAVIGAMAVWLRLNRVALNIREAKASDADMRRW